MKLISDGMMKVLKKAVSDKRAPIVMNRDEAEVCIQRKNLLPTLEKLRDDPALLFVQLMDVCGVDYPSREERFDVVYQLLSLKYNIRLRVILSTDEEKAVPSVVGLYPSAGWFEREVFDLFGIRFDGHPDLRRLLTDYDFKGFPLRRDFPLMGFEQVRYDDLNCCVTKEPVSLQQDYRAFDAQSPWLGMTDVQKREGGQS